MGRIENFLLFTLYIGRQTWYEARCLANQRLTEYKLSYFSLLYILSEVIIKHP
jgi:hypothetical protein